MDNKNYEKLNKILTLLRGKPATQKELEAFVVVVLNMIKESRDIFEKLSSENINKVEEIIRYIETKKDIVSSELDTLLESKKNDINSNVSDIKKEFTKDIKEAKDFLNEVKKIKTNKPKEVDEEKIKNDIFDSLINEISKVIPKTNDIVVDVLSKIPKNDVVVLDNGEKIVEKINDLPIDSDSYKIDYSHIKNIPKIEQKYVGTQLLSLLNDVRITNVLNNDVIAYNSTTHRFENKQISSGGTPALPLTSVQYNNGGSFGGDSFFTYDDVNKRLTSSIIEASSFLEISNNGGVYFYSDLHTTQTGGLTVNSAGVYDLLDGSSGQVGQINIAGLTTTRTYTFQDASGIVAFLSDIPSGGISSLNGLTDATQTFATGTAGTDFAISSSTGVHTFNIPDASSTARGLITTGNQTLAGVKSFGQSGGGTGTSATVVLRQNTNSTGATTRQDSPRLGLLARAWNGSANVNMQSEWYLHGIASLNPMEWVMAYVPDNTSPTSEKFTMRWNGTNLRVGINGITNPNAFLHLQAGTATAGTAPYKLSAGTNLLTPEPGAGEFDGVSLFFTPSTTRLRTVLTNNTIPSNGQLPIGNGTNYTNAALTAGTGISVTNGAGSITIANTGATSVTSGNTDYITASPTTGAVIVSPNRLIREQALSQKTTKVSGTTTETSLLSTEVTGTYTIDKETNRNFSRWEIVGTGYFGEVVDKLRLRVYFGSVVIADFGGQLAVNPLAGNTGWRLTVSAVRVTSTVVRVQGIFTYQSETGYDVIALTNTADVTVADMSSNNTVVDFTAEWDGTGSEIVRDIFYIERTDNNS